MCQLFNKISACYTHLDEITESKETNHISFNCLAFTLKQLSVFLPLKGYQNYFKILKITKHLKNFPENFEIPQNPIKVNKELSFYIC